MVGTILGPSISTSIQQNLEVSLCMFWDGNSRGHWKSDPWSSPSSNKATLQQSQWKPYGNWCSPATCQEWGAVLSDVHYQQRTREAPDPHLYFEGMKCHSITATMLVPEKQTESSNKINKSEQTTKMFRFWYRKKNHTSYNQEDCLPNEKW